MTQGIAASLFVNDTPGVLAAGGQAVDLNGMVLTNSTRVPIGTAVSFPGLLSVQAYFGAISAESNIAQVYFLGYDNSLQKPGSLLFTQYPTSAVSAYLRGGSVAALTLAQLQALGSGTVIVTINGTQWTSGTIALGAATSFSNAAALITTGLAANDASATGSIAPASATLTGVLASGVLTASAVTGPIVPGATLAGTGVNAGTTIISQLTGTAGAAGTYQTSGTQTLGSVAMTAINAAAGVFTAASALVGAFAPGQVLVGTGVTAGTVITANLTGTGGLGSYVVTPSQTAGSTTITGGGAIVTYDSVSGAFIITAGTPGVVSTIGFATGTLSTGLKLTSATGAVTSQGSAAAMPAAFMPALIAQTQNWASFMTTFEPTNADKIAFANWTNGTVDDYVYDMWSTDIIDTQIPNTGSAWATIKTDNYSGTVPIYAPVNTYLAAAFAMSFGACLDFGELNGRATAAFKSQTGLGIDVSSTAVASNLIANGLDFYGQIATRNPANNFAFFVNGAVSGPFLWLDSYLDQIWLNDNIVVTLLTLLTTIGSIPYNAAGYGMIENVLAHGPIADALNFGAIRSGVTLSATQTAYVNNAAGLNVAPVIQSTGWYLLIQPATPAVRQARQSPPMTLFYTDGQSIQQINLQSLEVA